MRIAAPVHLSPDQEQQLRSAAESQTVSVRFSRRAPIICLAAAGQQDIQIAASLGITRQPVVGVNASASTGSTG